MKNWLTDKGEIFFVFKSPSTCSYAVQCIVVNKEKQVFYIDMDFSLFFLLI